MLTFILPFFVLQKLKIRKKALEAKTSYSEELKKEIDSLLRIKFMSSEDEGFDDSDYGAPSILENRAVQSDDVVFGSEILGNAGVKI